MAKRLARDERAKVQRAAEITAWHWHVFKPFLFEANRGAIEIATARQVAMYLAHTVGQVSMTKLTRAFRRDLATVSHDIKKVEDLRDDGVIDAEMTYLEAKYRREIEAPARKARAA